MEFHCIKSSLNSQSCAASEFFYNLMDSLYRKSVRSFQSVGLIKEHLRAEPSMPQLDPHLAACFMDCIRQFLKLFYMMARVKPHIHISVRRRT